MNDPKTPAANPAASQYSERRRSHRVHIGMPIVVRIGPEAKRLEEKVQTIAVSAHGCSMRLTAAVGRGEKISVVNSRTTEELLCTVTFVGPEENGKIEVGVEFVEPSPLFWRITFPPEDWDPAERKRPSQPQQRPPVRPAPAPRR